LRFLAIAIVLLLSAAASGGPVDSFDDIQFWTGQGEHRAAMVVDWVEGSSDDQSLVWGFRWDGEANGQDMFRSIVAADPRFFAKVQDYGGSLGYAIYGIGYDDGDLNFALDDGTSFDADGLSAVSGSADGASPVDSNDFYEEGWFLGFWHYAVAGGNPYDGGGWASSGLGASSRRLTDGAWDSWAFTPSFDFSAFAQNPHAALQDAEPAPGDTNGDGKVDLDDLNNVRNQFGGSGLGDTDLDNDIDLDDLNNVRNHFGAGGGAAAVPEPATWFLLAIAGLASGGLFTRRRIA
jgi:hypothetical protein